VLVSVGCDCLVLRKMTIQTLLTTALGISKPIVQGGMMWVGYAEMAAAVSNAGGLGILVYLDSPRHPADV
jgi:NAD(P)H-dependent flavin oxidoreductase YrpB (nitropropane dioxygenase family)